MINEEAVLMSAVTIVANSLTTHARAQARVANCEGWDGDPRQHCPGCLGDHR